MTSKPIPCPSCKGDTPIRLTQWQPGCYEQVVQGVEGYWLDCTKCGGLGVDIDAEIALGKAQRAAWATPDIHEPRRCPECDALATNGRFCRGHWLEEQVAAAEHYSGIHRSMDDR